MSGMLDLIILGIIHHTSSELEDRNMSADYIILTIIAVAAIGGGLFLLSQAKSYRKRHRIDDKKLKHAKG